MQKTKDSNLLYSGWLLHHGTHYNTNTWPSFLITLTSVLKTQSNFSNSRSRFWFSLKASKAQRSRVSETWPLVLKQILSRAFWWCKFWRIWSLKSIIDSLKYNLIVSNLQLTNNSWSYFLRQSNSFILIGAILVTYVKYLISDLIINFWRKKQKWRKGEKN